MAFLLHKVPRVPDKISHHVRDYIDTLAMKDYTDKAVLYIYFVNQLNLTEQINFIHNIFALK